MASWADLMGDALAEVFKRLPVEERVRTVPLVCKAWKTASRDPACWRDVDLVGWFQEKMEREYWWELECEPAMELIVINLVDRSQGQLKELRTFHCTDTVIEHIAETCPSLAVLSIPNSLKVTNSSAAKLAASCSKLQQLDVSDCYNISDQALTTFGQNCKSLTLLNRNMLERKQEPVARKAEPGGDEEAIAVSKHMGKLKHLEMKKTGLSDLGLAHLANGCGQLETLNLACCSALSPTSLENIAKQCVNLKDFTRPITPRMCVDAPYCMFFY